MNKILNLIKNLLLKSLPRSHFTKTLLKLNKLQLSTYSNQIESHFKTSIEYPEIGSFIIKHIVIDTLYISRQTTCHCLFRNIVHNKNCRVLKYYFSPNTNFPICPTSSSNWYIFIRINLLPPCHHQQ